jgi:hypothetical protein
LKVRHAHVSAILPLELIIIFSQPNDVTRPGQDGVQYSFPFSVVDSALIGAPEQRSQTRHHRVIVAISRTRRNGWRISDADLPKILFEFGKRHIAKLIHSNELPEVEKIISPMITNDSHPESECPFDPAMIPSPTGHIFTVERAKPTIGFVP